MDINDPQKNTNNKCEWLCEQLSFPPLLAFISLTCFAILLILLHFLINYLKFKYGHTVGDHIFEIIFALIFGPIPLILYFVISTILKNKDDNHK